MRRTVVALALAGLVSSLTPTYGADEVAEVVLVRPQVVLRSHLAREGPDPLVGRRSSPWAERAVAAATGAVSGWRVSPGLSAGCPADCAGRALGPWQGLATPPPTQPSLPQGIDLVLLVDKSASGDDQFRDIQHVAITLLGQLSPADRVELVDFDAGVEVVEPFTSDHARVEETIGRMRAGGSTTLYNGLYLSLRQLAETRSEASPDARLQVIVLLSDSEGTSSQVAFKQVLELAKRSQVAIYSIAIQSRDSRSRSGFRDFVLRRLAEETGGQAFFPGAARSDREAAALQVAKALATIRP